MTFETLLAQLRALPTEAPLTFTTEQGRIAGGYHVTEFRVSAGTGIDCGGNIWPATGARMQLLDGHGGAHMTLGTFTTILTQSLARLPDLAQAPVQVEFSHGNAGLALYEIAAPRRDGDAAVIGLRPSKAMCRPAWVLGCCTPQEACCG